MSEPPPDPGAPASSRRPVLVDPWPTMADACAEVLEEHGLDTIYTVPGGPVMPLLRALGARGCFECILTASEAGALLAAEGHFRVTGEMAVVVVTAGPGAMNTIASAGLMLRELSAGLILSAQVPRIHLRRAAAQEFDTVAALAPVTKLSVALEHPDRAADTLSELITLARSGRPGPVHASGFADSWLKPVQKGRVHSPLPAFRSSSALGVPAAAEALGRAVRPVMLLGYGAVLSRAAEAARELAALLPNLRVACSPRAKGLFPEGHPQSLGVFGFAGHDQAMAAVAASDLLLVAGSRLGEITTAGYAALEHKTLIQIDAHAPELGRVHHAEHRLAGDATELIEALTRALAGSRIEHRRLA